MADINNGSAGHLVIAGVHDGRCGVQAGDTPIVAFRWARTGKRPEVALAAGGGATLDGVDYGIESIARSPLSAGFYVAVLARRAA